MYAFSALDIPPRETLFHFAARLGLQQVTEFFMYQPGSLDALSLQNNTGQLPIDIATERRDDKLVNTLLGWVDTHNHCCWFWGLEYRCICNTFISNINNISLMLPVVKIREWVWILTVHFLYVFNYLSPNSSLWLLDHQPLFSQCACSLIILGNLLACKTCRQGARLVNVIFA